MQILLRFLLNPLAWVSYSAVFFYFSLLKIKDPVKIILCLKCHCILMMPLAIEAIIRSLYIRDMWGYLEAYHVSFLILSILVLLFCIFTLNDNFSSLITRKIYFCNALVLIAMIIIFPFVSVMFATPFQILSAWGCITISLYGLSRYVVLSKDVPDQEEIVTLKRERILAIIEVIFCLVLMVAISPFAFNAFREAYFVFLPIVPILILCLCIFTLNDKVSDFIIRNIYLCITLALITMIAMIAIFIYTSWVFRPLKDLAGMGCAAAVLYLLLLYYNPDNEVGLQEKELVLRNMLCFCFRLTLCAIVFLFLYISGTLISRDSKGTHMFLIIVSCMAAILYSLLRYVSPGKIAAEISEKQRILRNMLRFCIVLTIWVFYCPLFIDLNPGDKTNSSISFVFQSHIVHAISQYQRAHPGWTSQFSPEETVDITDRIASVDSFIRNGLSKYVKTGAISIMLKNKKFVLQFNVEAWRYSNRGIWSSFLWIFEESLEDYKKELAKDKNNYNSPDFDSPYDGTSSVFFRRSAW